MKDDNKVRRAVILLFGTEYVISRVHTIQGDPGHMETEKRKLRHVIRTDGCPTDWSTWAFNDTNLPDLHNYKILPYRPDDKNGPHDAKTRKRMTWNNPASCALWFMIRRLTHD